MNEMEKEQTDELIELKKVTVNNIKIFKKARVDEQSRKNAIKKQVEIENSRKDSLQSSAEQLRYLRTVSRIEGETDEQYWDKYYLEKYEREMNLEMDLETDKNMNEAEMEKKLEQVDSLNNFVQNIGNTNKNNESQVEEKQLSLFKKVGVFFTKSINKEKKDQSIKIELFDPLEEKVDDLININSLVLVHNMTEKGYKLTEKQKVDFNNKIQQKINEQRNDELINLISNGYKVEESLLINNVISTRYENYVNSIDLIKSINRKFMDSWNNKVGVDIWGENNLSSKIIKETKKQFNNCFEVFQNEEEITKKKFFNNRTYSIKQIKQMKKAYESLSCTVDIISYLFPVINKNLKMEEYFEMVVLLKKINNYTDKMVEDLIKKDEKKYKAHFFGDHCYSVKLKIEEMEKNLKENFKKENELFLETVGEKVIESYLNTIVKDNTNNKSLNFDSFPKKISSSLMVLSNRIKDIHQEKHEIEQHEWSQLEKLWSNHLFKSIEAYFKISSKYISETQSVENKNANDLLLETINNIDEILKNKLLLINENRLSDLSVIQRQTKELKKSF